ncbi:hypothetical protein QFC19_005371 [Naganishia cerealis]|uniref:Uncharacterized protein n=1 Tax=Naganishia cerealis TaxID=610337 RepID=A0ACC2VNI2_9TREE|nr:hypothetical protein QFC19_005371 [Naganishia cerealis]
MNVPDITAGDHANDVSGRGICGLPGDIDVGALCGVFGGGVKEEVREDGARSVKERCCECADQVTGKRKTHPRRHELLSEDPTAELEGKE